MPRLSNCIRPEYIVNNYLLNKSRMEKQTDAINYSNTLRLASSGTNFHTKPFALPPGFSPRRDAKGCLRLNSAQWREEANPKTVLRSNTSTSWTQERSRGSFCTTRADTYIIAGWCWWPVLSASVAAGGKGVCDQALTLVTSGRWISANVRHQLCCPALNSTEITRQLDLSAILTLWLWHSSVMRTHPRM